MTKRSAVAVLLWTVGLGLATLEAADTAPHSSAPQSSAASESAANYRKLVDKYCVGCHNQRLSSGGLRLDPAGPADLTRVPAGAETWEKVVRKLRAGAMPPPGAPRPGAGEYKAFASFLESQLDAAALANPYAGRPLLHRMNRAEYANAIRDLLGLDVDAAALLPPDDSAYGFDNV